MREKGINADLHLPHVTEINESKWNEFKRQEYNDDYS